MSNFRLLRPAVLGLLLLAATSTAAAERTAPEILPQSTAVYLEIRDPQQLISTVYDHKLTQRFYELDQVRSAMEKKEYLQFKAGVAVIESQMGMPWRKIVGQAAGGGIAAAIDAKTKGAVVVARSLNEATGPKMLDILANLAQQDAKNKGNPDPIQTGEYRGVKTYTVGKGTIAATAGWIVATNNEELGKKVVDNILDSTAESFVANDQFAKAHAAEDASTTLWGYINTATIRDAGLAKKVFGGQADNPLAELIFGGILSTLQKTPFVTFDLTVGEQDIKLKATAPYDRAWAGEAREYFFGPEGKGTAPPLLAVDGAIASLSGYRDASAMWRHAGDLFNEQTSEELTKADSSLTTLFAGKDFGDDILGAFQPEGYVVVVRQEFAKDQPAPAIKLPAFGVVAEMRDPTKMQPELRRIFQSLVGFFNVIGAMNGQPQLELDMEKGDGTQFVTAGYLPDTKSKDQQALKINYNFSPSIGFVGGRFVLASTKELAHALVATKPGERSASDGSPVVNTSGVLHFDKLQETLRDNRSQLVSQNMLNEGHTKEEAEKQIGVLLELVGYLDRLGVSLDTTASELRLSVDVGLKQAD